MVNKNKRLIMLIYCGMTAYAENDIILTQNAVQHALQSQSSSQPYLQQTQSDSYANRHWSLPSLKIIASGIAGIYCATYGYILYLEHTINRLPWAHWRSETPLLALQELSSDLIMGAVIGNATGITRIEKILTILQEIASEESIIARYLWLTRYKALRLLSHQAQTGQSCADYLSRLNFLKNALIASLVN